MWEFYPAHSVSLSSLRQLTARAAGISRHLPGRKTGEPAAGALRAAGCVCAKVWGESQCQHGGVARSGVPVVTDGLLVLSTSPACPAIAQCHSSVPGCPGLAGRTGREAACPAGHSQPCPALGCLAHRTLMPPPSLLHICLCGKPPRPVPPPLWAPGSQQAEVFTYPPAHSKSALLPGTCVLGLGVRQGPH